MQTIKLNGWVAEDEDGTQVFYYNEPYHDRSEWLPAGGNMIENFNRFDLGPDWRKSKRRVINNVIQDPRPDLKVDDLVWVRSSPNMSWCIRCFAKWSYSGGIITFVNGETSASMKSTTIWPEYKLP